MTYRLTYRRVKANDISNTISNDQIPLLSQPTRVGIPNFSYIRNKRDNDLESTKGNYTTVDGGVADRYFASETDFGRLLVQNSTYHALGKNRERKFVLARSTRIGVDLSSTCGTFFCRRRKLASRIRIESGGAARSRDRLPPWRNRVVREQY
jgi:outer membrane protein insertion porin family